MHCSTCLFFIYALLCIAYDLRSHSVPLLVHLLFVLPGLIVFGNQLHGAFQACALTAHQMVPDTLPDTSSAMLPRWLPIRTALLPLLPGLLALLLSKLTREALGLGDALFLLIAGLYVPMRSMLLLLLSGILVGFLVSASCSSMAISTAGACETYASHGFPAHCRRSARSLLHSSRWSDPVSPAAPLAASDRKLTSSIR